MSGINYIIWLTVFLQKSKYLSNNSILILTRSYFAVYIKQAIAIWEGV